MSGKYAVSFQKKISIFADWPGLKIKFINFIVVTLQLIYYI